MSSVTVTAPYNDASETSARTFDYAGLPDTVAAEARRIVDRYRERGQNHILETGRDLIRMKKALGHGAFGAWITAEFNMSERTAHNYMRAAEAFDGDKSAIVALLPPSTVYALAAKSAP
jgi:hypothetical protein